MSHKDPNNRRASFKLPPLARGGLGEAQEARRLAASEQQQKRREKLIDAARAQSYFAALGTLTPDSPDDEPPTPPSPVAFFPSTDPPPLPPASAALSIDGVPISPTHTHGALGLAGKKHQQQQPRKSEQRWANKLMFAELLEMGPKAEEDAMSLGDGEDAGAGAGAGVVMGEDGLPDDLESGWVALAPVPVGKRCMAVTYAMGNGAVVTALHSRLSGHLFLRYPSALPADTILDCILDSRWQETGLLHILDVMRWRSQDLSTCEAEFRLWFLSQRMAEQPVVPAPSGQPFKQPFIHVPVPVYHPPLSLELLLLSVIPLAKTGRVVPLLAPVPMPPSPGAVRDTMPVDEFGRAIPGAVPVNPFFGGGVPQGVRETHCASDGLLLYVKAGTYQSGATPLACWVPNQPIEGESESRLDVFERMLTARVVAQQSVPNGDEMQMEG